MRRSIFYHNDHSENVGNVFIEILKFFLPIGSVSLLTRLPRNFMDGPLPISAKVVYQSRLLADRADPLRVLRLTIEQDTLAVVFEVGAEIEAPQVWTAMYAAYWIPDSLTSELKLTQLARNYDESCGHYGFPGETARAQCCKIRRHFLAELHAAHLHAPASYATAVHVPDPHTLAPHVRASHAHVSHSFVSHAPALDVPDSHALVVHDPAAHARAAAF